MHESFDSLTREVARARSRREALKVLGQGLITLVVASLGSRRVSAADIDQAACRERCSKTCTTIVAGRARTDLACVRTCASACTPGSCPPGTPDLCAADPVTIESLDAARAALASGVNEGPLSPAGCVSYRVVLDSSGGIASQAILHAGLPILVWNHTPTQSTGARDLDLNGCPDWRATARRGATEADEKLVVEDLVEATTPRVLRRQTYTSTNDLMHVVIEEADSAGTLSTVTVFDTDIGLFAGGAAAAAQTVSTNGCDQAVAQRLEDALHDGIATGLECMAHFKKGDIATTMQWNYLFRPVVFRCQSLPDDFIAGVTRRSYMDPSSDITIFVDPGRFSDLSDYEQGKILWHEMLHLHFGPHNEKAKTLSRYDEYDEVTACEDLCFGPADVTKCKCARCLKTDKCDPRCQIYQECDSSIGYICPCPAGPNAYRYFDTCTECLVTCPSGLACFGFSRCSPVTVLCSSEAPMPCP